MGEKQEKRQEYKEHSVYQDLDIDLKDLVEDYDLFRRLEKLDNDSVLRLSYVNIFLGGVNAIRIENVHNNDDWLSQSANSFRDILYSLQGQDGNGQVEKVLKNYIKRPLSQKELKKNKRYIHNLYDFFSDVTHHFRDVKDLKTKEYKISESITIKPTALDREEYIKAVKRYAQYLKILVTTSIDIHADVDQFFDKNNAHELKTSTKEKAKKIINFSEDSKSYFFHKAPPKWIDTFFEWGFFVGLQNPQFTDSENLLDVTSELNFLAKCVDHTPGSIVNIIQVSSNATTKGNFNLEIVERFLWIISKLPAEQISDLTPKILKEEWIKNRGFYNHSSYKFKEMVEKLAEKGEYKALLELAQVIMSIMDFKERDVEELTGYMENPFCLSDITQSGIFEKLLEIEGDKRVDVVEILSNILSKVIKNSRKNSESDIFKYTDSDSFYDENLFDLKITNKAGYSSRDDIKNLVAVLVHSAGKIIRELCDKKSEKAEQIVDLLPDKSLSRLTWQMHLTILAQCPDVFAHDLEDMFFKIFDVENYYDIEGGSEYEESLNRSFEVIERKKEYINKVFEFFKTKSEKYPDQKWHKRTGWKIISSIPQKFINEDDKKKCKELFDAPPDENYQPKTSISKVRGGMVNHRSPVSLDDYDVEEIFQNLKEEWMPEKLKEKYKDDDFLRPRGVEGLGDALKSNLIDRPEKYLNTLIDEKELENFASHYVYSMMRGLEDLSRNGKQWSKSELDLIIDIFIKIAKLYKEENLFNKNSDSSDSWLATWTTVHKPIVDTLLYIVRQENIKEYIDKNENREKIYTLFEYELTKIKDPRPESEDPKYGDLYHIAINSVRGRAFEAFTVFIEREGDALCNEAKNLYKRVLKDNSLAVRFVVGRYLASYYFRDKVFIRDLLNEIFPKNSEMDLFLAGWGGYLSNSLYNGLFEEMDPYYRYAFSLNEDDYPKKREYVRNHSLDKALAIHMALAFAHLGEDYEEDSIVAEFWKIDNTERFKEFISFIGRSLINRDRASKEFLEEQNVELKRLKNFWEWVLDEKSELDPEIFSGFGFWINPQKEIITDSKLVSLVERTLTKSKGACDWELGLMDRLPLWAKEQDSERVLSIVRSYLLDGNKLNNKNHYSLTYKDKIKETLYIIYKNGDKKVKNSVIQLIDDLIKTGSKMFWDFKKVVKNK